MEPIAAETPGLWRALWGCGVRRELIEYLDHTNVDSPALRQNLAHLRFLNRALGWSGGVAAAVRRVLDQRKLTAVSLLDVATGSADIPLRVAARERRVETVLGSDVAPAVLRAALAADSERRMQLLCHEGTRLPLRDRAVDIVTFNLAAHHFAPPALTRTLAELWRVTRHGLIVTDLVRSRSDYVLARLMAQALRNPLTSHDGPVSVLRAYTPDELALMAKAAGITGGQVTRRFPARMTLVALKPMVTPADCGR